MLSDSELDHALALAVDLAGLAADTIVRGDPGAVRTKAGPADLVTDVDLAVERAVTTVLHRELPGHRVQGEELGASGAAPGAPTWYLDPVDGTTNFAAGIPWASFSLALADEDGPAVGVVCDPFRGEVWTATRGGGAHLNGVALAVPAVCALAGSVVLTEWSGHQPWPGMNGVLAALSDRACTVRIMGSSALSLVMAASGRCAATIIGSYHHVDDMAGVLVAREAGACVRGRDGSTTPGPDGVLAGAGPVVDELQKIWEHERAGPAA